MSGDERYVMTTAGGPYILPSTFKPSVLSPTEYTPNLVRARNSRRVFDLGDGLPPPTPIVLSGEVIYATENELAQGLRVLRAAAHVCTVLSRDGRPGIQITGAYMMAAPVQNISNAALVTLTLIPYELPDETTGLYDW